MAAAAVARVIAVASNSTTAASSCLRLKTPFALKRCSNALSFNNGGRLSKRLFSCNAIYNPQVHIKEEGQPETLDYRVFFEDASGKKGTLTAVGDWFRDYKIPDGKPANKFGLGNKAANKDYALKVITETNESWAKLVKRSIPAGELSLL